MTVRRLLLRLYPRWWRDRYGEEFEALLADLPLSLSAILDVAVAALRARVAPDNTPWRWTPMADRLLSLELSIFAAWTGFVVAGAAFAKLTDDPPLRLVDDPLISRLGYDVVVIAAIASLAGVAIAGVPIGIAVAIDALRRRHGSQLALLGVPVLAAAVWLSVTAVLSTIPFQVTDDVPRFLFFVLWVATGLLGVTVSCLALAVAARRAQVDVRLYRRAINPAFITVFGILGGTIAVVVWGVGLFISDNYDFWGFSGLLATSTAVSWSAIALTMTIASVVAVRAAARLRSAEA